MGCFVFNFYIPLPLFRPILCINLTVILSTAAAEANERTRQRSLHGDSCCLQPSIFSPPKHSNRVRRSRPLRGPPGKVSFASVQQQRFGLLATRSLRFLTLGWVFCYLRPPLPRFNGVLRWYQAVELRPPLAAFRAGWLTWCF